MKKTLFKYTISIGILYTIVKLVPTYAAVVDRIAIKVPQSCTISSSLNPAHMATIENGTYKDEIGETIVKTVCNDGEGFSIYAIGYTDDELGKNVLSSVLGDGHSIMTGTAVSGDDSNWAMKLSAFQDGDSPSILSDANGSFGSYHVVPSQYTKVATRQSSTDSSLGSSFKTTYAAYVSKTQAAGNYHGKVKYVMVHPSNKPEPYVPTEINCEPNSICYYPNSNDHDGTMGNQRIDDDGAILVDNATVTLLASNYNRPGYGFAGWSDTFDYSGKVYGPNETIVAPTGIAERGLSLYAVWVKSEGILQDAMTTSSVCNRLSIAQVGQVTLDSVSALTDQRDDQTYAIAKLADGNCWMIENLRLDATASMFESLSQGYSSSFIGLAEPEEPSLFANITTANSLYSAETNVDGKVPILGTSVEQRFPRYNNINTYNRAINPISNNVGGINNGSMYSFGNYYTWSAAVADTSERSGYDSKTTSICPKGWHIPTGGVNGEFYNLNLLSNSNATDTSVGLRAFPNNLSYSGFIDDGTIYNRGYDGHYWSSSPNGSNYVYYLYLGRNFNYPGSKYDDGHFGMSIRCLVNR